MSDLQLINIDTDKLYGKLEDYNDFYGGNLDNMSKEAFNAAVSDCFEIETTEVKGASNSDRNTYIYKDGSKNIRVENIYLHPLKLIKLAIETAVLIKNPNLTALLIIIIDFLNMLSFSMDVKHTFVLYSIYKATAAGRIVDDDNLYDIIQSGYKEEKIDMIGERELYDIIRFLTKKNLISIDDGVYAIEDKIIIKA